MRECLVAIGLLLVAIANSQEANVPLNDGWTFHRLGDTIVRPSRVPGTVQADLLRLGVIPDPYFDANIDSIQWVGDSDWVFTRTILVDDAFLGNEHIDLVFEGLDTFAEVVLNGTPLGTADNMFRTWEFPIRDQLHPGSNTLQVTFRSSRKEGEKLRAAFGIQLPADNEVGAIKVSPYVRKAACQFGWDFTPPLLTCGIWRPVYLRCWSTARIDQVRIDQVIVGSTAVVGVEAHLEGTFVEPLDLVLDIDGDRTTVHVPAGAGSARLRSSLSIADARRWWPNGEGEQVLYPVRVELIQGGRSLSTWERRIGLRSISLDQHEGAFAFIVNGEPIFMKGANLVPPDLLLSGTGDGAWVQLVRDMQLAHMNMVRVWAGGIYPPDAFFNACDTAGILVWQDLLFANIPPDDPPFMTNVHGEIQDQVTRLRHHPCLALLCGNNELEVAWNNWGWQGTYGIHGRDSSRVSTSMQRFFEEDLPREIGRYGDIPYTPTSPLSNWGNEEGLRTGDLHYWGVWHGDSAIASFRNNVGRFVSEYGFQSYPDSSVLARCLGSGDLHLGSAMLERRQRSYKTDRPIWDAIQLEFGVRPRTLDEFITYGQLVQAEAHRQAAWAHRAAQPHCMGSLFWQLNDRWPGPSWSAMDFAGNWKPVMHEIQRAYAPIVLQLSRKGDRCIAEVLNEGSAGAAKLVLRVVHTDRTVVSSDTLMVELTPGPQVTWAGEVARLLGPEPPERCLLIVELQDGEGGQLWRALPLAPWSNMRWAGTPVAEIKALQASPEKWLRGR